MDYRSILVQVDATRGARGRVAAAARIASEMKASLTGVFLKSDLMPGFMAGEGVVAPVTAADEFFEERRARTAAASAAARAVFEAAARDAGMPYHWYDINGDFDAELVAFARRHDLTVLPRRMKAAFGNRTISAEHIGMASGGPVLLMPEGGYPADFGRRIMVAWKDTREAARVLRDAWPFMRKAEEVCFVTVDSDSGQRLDGVLLRHLADHGCKTVRLVVDSNEEAAAGDVLLRQIAMVGADMAILGLFGHSRLHEFVLGGVSRSLLDNPSMPVLVSH